MKIRRPPWYLLAPVLLSGVGVLLPLGYLAVSAVQVEPEELAANLWRGRALWWLSNTLLLVVSNLVVTTSIALPAAWLITRSNLPLRKFFTLAMILPLAVPGYLLAFALLAVGGDYGALAQLTGGAWSLPRLSGFWGSLVALSLYNFPYMLLPLRAALNEMDPAMAEIAQSLGCRPLRTFFAVTLPQLRPALLTGSLLIGLHVINDFGVVSLMGYETFSYALYQQYVSAYEPVTAAPIALMMLALAGCFIAAELWLLRGLRLHRAGAGTARAHKVVAIGWWKLPAAAFLLAVLGAAVVVPVGTILYWARHAPWAELLNPLAEAVGCSLMVSLPAALLATLLAVPVAYVARRYPCKRSLLFERISYLGYATPALAFALGLLVGSMKVDQLFVPAGQTLFYQSLLILVYAYSLHFMAEAVGPIRAALFQATPRLEEASRSLGRGQIRTFLSVTLPLLRSGLIVSMVLVFLSAMKELPLTFLLRPIGFETLSFNIWDATNNASYADAAPFALLILLLSSLFVGVLLQSERNG